MNKIALIVLLVVIICPYIISQQVLQPDYEAANFDFAAPGANKFGLYGYDNPAILTYLHQPDIYFTWNDLNSDFNDRDNWGLFTAIPNFGFSVVSYGGKNHSVTDYSLSTAFGGPVFSLGLGYSWLSGKSELFNYSNKITIGSLLRFNRYLSLGLVANLPNEGENRGIIDLAVRPFGNQLLAFFADYIMTNEKAVKDNKWSAGAVLEPLDGIRFTGRFFEGKSFNLGTQISFGNFGINYQSHFIDDEKHAFNTYGIRLGAYDRSIFPNLFNKDKYVKLDLLGGIRYQRYQLFDNSNTLIDLVKQIEAANNDNSVTGIAINLTGLNANREMMWEIREKLKEFKYGGKKIVLFADRLNIDGYHLASVADKIVLDPLGTITLEGYVLGRTFYKGALEKLGIGFTELRYFKYKSAAESYSRDKMSDADREQRQRLVDEFYRIAKTDICKERNFSDQKFEQLVNEYAMFSPEEAFELGLVDTLGRWDTVTDIIKSLNNDKVNLISSASLKDFNLPRDNYWGRKPAIAVIYAIGGTQLDAGIKARSLVKYVESAVKNSNVKAIVLRVDSPGGDALASDLIAEELKKAKGKKPVIVSQGSVAASGGYWLSMYADTIVAAPNTVTGSIGVIGLWVYNTELKDKLGFTTDRVKVGKFSDLNFGATIPLLGLTIPDRNLNDEELIKAETLIRKMYKEFVSKVAAGRNKSFDEIDKIGEGRVWSGADGLSNGLVDVLGGLETAINIAVEKAGLKNKQFEIVELPERPLIDIGKFIPSFVPGFFSTEKDPFINELRFRILNNGIPMPVLPIDFITNDMIFNRY
jgi:protease IV